MGFVLAAKRIQPCSVPIGAEVILILTLDVLEALDTKGVTWSWLDEAKKT